MAKRIDMLEAITEFSSAKRTDRTVYTAEVWGKKCVQDHTAVSKMVCFIDIKRFLPLSIQYTKWIKNSR
jgi:hypothetical protein